MDVEERIVTAWRTWTTRRAQETARPDERAPEAPRPAALRGIVPGGEPADATAHIALTIDDR